MGYSSLVDWTGRSTESWTTDGRPGCEAPATEIAGAGDITLEREQRDGEISAIDAGFMGSFHVR
jgi:hypothetical protein